MRTILLAVLLATQTAPPIFRFETDGFWLNLHHFLYVLGRVEAKMPDIRRGAVAGAPADEAEGLKALGEDDRRTWRDAVTVYASRLSRQDAIFDAGVVDVTSALGRLAGDRPASAAGIAPAVAAALDRAAPIYRRAWWPRHRDANRAWRDAMQGLLPRYGPRVLAYVTRSYQEAWMPGGYPVNVSAYTNWAGAYSTRGQLLVIASLSEGNAGAQGFEIMFHEAMHQWDDAVQARLQRLAKQHNLPVKDLLTHAMIFYTAGEAVRSVVPGHTPYAEVAGIWNRGMRPFKPALDAYWKPHLEGKITLDEALLALLKS